MADEVLVLKGQGQVDVQVGGPGNNWNYLSACASMDGPSVPRGATEQRWCQDPKQAGGFKVSSKIKGAPDQVSGNLMTKLGKIDYLDGLECTFTLRARYASCGEREDPSNYDPLMLSFCDVDLNEHGYDDLVVVSPENNDEILMTAPWTASAEFRVKFPSFGRIGASATNVGDQPVNDITFCDEASCGGYCGNRSDGCTTFYAVTDADAAPYAAPNLIKGVRNLITDAWTWSLDPILGLNGDANAVECAGSRILVAGNADSVVAYNTNDGDPDDWNPVVLGNAPSANPNALFARTAREIWVACNNGYVYKSVDGGATYNAMHSAELTTENLNAVFAFDRELVYAAGDNGVMIKSEDGGSTWADITEVATTSANLLVMKVPPGRSKEVFVGTNDGQIFKSTDEGAIFANVPFTGDGVGTVDDLAFCGPCMGEVLWILHNDSGPRGRILRDLSGGAGGADVEVVAGYGDIIAAGVELNALSCCSANEIVAGGELSGGYPVIVRVS